jgi:hypothetical protein
MGELIEFKKGAGNVWEDAGEAFPEEDGPDSPQPGLLMLPILLFLDGLSLAVAVICRPLAAILVLAAGAAVWAALRDLIGIGASWTLLVCLIAWLGAHRVGRNIDQAIKTVEAGEAALMRRAAQRSEKLGRGLHLMLYVLVGLAPFGFAALVTGMLTPPAWLPRSLVFLAPLPASPLVALILALGPAVAAVATRYYWHPVARYSTLLGRKRKFTVAVGAKAA